MCKKWGKKFLRHKNMQAAARSKNVLFLRFTDDTVMYFSAGDSQVIADTLTNELVLVNKWLTIFEGGLLVSFLSNLNFDVNSAEALVFSRFHKTSFFLTNQNIIIYPWWSGIAAKLHPWQKLIDCRQYKILKINCT